jgi:hypothetical protein
MTIGGGLADHPGLEFLVISKAITSRTHMHQMFEMFIPYRVLDLLAMVEGIPGLVAVPKHIKMANLGIMAKTVGFNHQ